LRHASSYQPFGPQPNDDRLNQRRAEHKSPTFTQVSCLSWTAGRGVSTVECLQGAASKARSPDSRMPAGPGYRRTGWRGVPGRGAAAARRRGEYVRTAGEPGSTTAPTSASVNSVVGRDGCDCAAEAASLLSAVAARASGTISPSIYETARLVSTADWLPGH